MQLLPWSIALAVALHSAPAFAQARPRKPKDDVDVSAFRDQLVVLHDGSDHYLTLVPFGDGATLFYGDGKLFHQQRVYSSLANTIENKMAFNFWSPQVGSGEIELAERKWVVRCGERETPLTPVSPKQQQTLLGKAKFKRPLWRRMAYALSRDEDGVYYYVDRLRDEDGGKGFRLFRGRKGKLTAQKMIDIVHDSEGDVFATSTGDLRLILAKGKSTWVSRKKKAEQRTELTIVPVEENGTLIYGELGVYNERLGTPCDDL